MKKLEELLQLTPRQVIALQDIMQSDFIEAEDKGDVINDINRWIEEKERFRLKQEVYSHMEWDEVEIVVKEFKKEGNLFFIYSLLIEVNEYPLQATFYFNNEELGYFSVNHTTDDICPHCEKHNDDLRKCERFENKGQMKRFIERLREIKEF
jgi:hypothetical protein